MNNLLDFAGLLLYYVVLPLLLPVQALLYALAGVWFTLIFCHRLLAELLRAFWQLRVNTRSVAGKVYLLSWRKKLLKVPA